jgi:hypothetical protein
MSLRATPSAWPTLAVLTEELVACCGAAHLALANLLTIFIMKRSVDERYDKTSTAFGFPTATSYAAGVCRSSLRDTGMSLREGIPNLQLHRLQLRYHSTRWTQLIDGDLCRMYDR